MPPLRVHTPRYTPRSAPCGRSVTTVTVSVVAWFKTSKAVPCLVLSVNISTGLDEGVQHVSVARHSRPDKAGRVVLG
jgi:hypothetical protein